MRRLLRSRLACMMASRQASATPTASPTVMSMNAVQTYVTIHAKKSNQLIRHSDLTDTQTDRLSRSRPRQSNGRTDVASHSIT